MKCGSKRRLKPTISLAPVSSTTLMQAFTRATSRVDRLFAEDRLAGAGEALDQVGMRIGRRADDDGVDILGGLDRFDRAHFAAIGGSDRFGSLREGVGDGHELCIGIAADGLCMDLADAAGAEKTKSHCHYCLPIFGTNKPN